MNINSKNIMKLSSLVVLVIALFFMPKITAQAASRSGVCGDNLTWELSEDESVLTISGYGDMYDYVRDANETPVPWAMEGGPFGNPYIKIVNLPDGLTSIGTDAFAGCYRIKSINVPNSVNSIGDAAFGDCDKLESFTFPNSLTKIESAFDDCERLTTITIPVSVTYINIDTFGTMDANGICTCNLTDIYYEGTEEQWNAIEHYTNYLNDENLKNDWARTFYDVTVHFNSGSNEPSPAPSQDSQVRAFVTRMYQVALDREPDESGLNDWTNQLISGQAAAVDIVRGFLCSQEYTQKNKSNGEIVNDCYRSMLGRDADESGYNDWVNRLNNGATVDAIFAGFVGSTEFINLCNSYGIAPGTYEIPEGTPDGSSSDNSSTDNGANEGVREFVTRLYTQALGRDYDEAGLNDWCNQINANPSRDNILSVATNGFFHSQEFINKNLDNTEFVKTCYRTYLGREAEEAGLNDWVGQLDRDEKSRDDVMAGFAYSDEFGNIMASFGL